MTIMSYQLTQRLNLTRLFSLRSSASPESGLGTSHTSLHNSGGVEHSEPAINDEMYYEVEPLQPLGTCRALYPFDGKFINRMFSGP